MLTYSISPLPIQEVAKFVRALRAPAMFTPFEKPTAIVCSTFGGCGWLYAEPKLIGPRAVIGCPAAVID